MDSDLLRQAADLTIRAIAALDRAGAEADFAAAMLDHGLKLVEELIAQAATAAASTAAAGAS